MTQEKNNHFGIFLRKSMQIENISQSELGLKSGVSQGAISRYLNGKAAPKADELFRISRVLGVSMEWLLSGIGDSPEARPDLPLKAVRAEVRRLGEALDSAEDAAKKLRNFFGL